MNSDTSGNKKTSFQTTEVKNFTGADALKVSARDGWAADGAADDIPALVTLTQRGASLSFQFSMTVAQARELAFQLLSAVDALEG